MKEKEHQSIEWKESWQDEYLKWICGYANAYGGTIYIGTDDDGNVVGIDNARDLLERIPNKITDTMGIIADVNLLYNSKVSDVSKTSIKEIIYTQNRFNLDNLYLKHPEYKSVIGSEGKDRRFRNNIFEKIPSFLEKAANESDIAVIGVIKNKRYWRYIDKELMDLEHENLMKWKVIVPRANGKGVLGEILSSPIILEPNQGYTQTFIGIGAFDTNYEADSLLKYIKSKFLRTMLSILKIDQHNERDTWAKIPLQDFTDKSDINWSVSIANIDKQLYKKYGLSEEEIAFIENNVKEME